MRTPPDSLRSASGARHLIRAPAEEEVLGKQAIDCQGPRQEELRASSNQPGEARRSRPVKDSPAHGAHAPPCAAYPVFSLPLESRRRQ
mmetsp:Transcript_95140/g.307216  ORF Transcript_95140/g.307216 Transcript_95140/m.307216 type:complete len:88 (+) Transcript_95140:21-284(+)